MTPVSRGPYTNRMRSMHNTSGSPRGLTGVLDIQLFVVFFAKEFSLAFRVEGMNFYCSNELSTMKASV